jgi:hypothetical protein
VKRITFKRMKISLLVLALVVLLTWVILAALVSSNHLPGYVTVKAAASMISMVFTS